MPRGVCGAQCQVEMLMSYAFITTGDKLFVVPDGFDRGATRSLKVNREAITGRSMSLVSWP